MSWQIPPKDKRAKQLRSIRARLEEKLRRCEVLESRDYYMLRIEKINILLQDMGKVVYPNPNGKHRATF